VRDADVDTKKEHLTRKQIIAKANRARMTNAALRAAGDPAVLAKAARIVRAGFERGTLTLADLDGPIVPPQASP
jgi:hypothetical protein